MKYLMLFEAFETKAISNIVNYLRKKLGSEESQEFLRFLRKSQESLDFPLSKISDKDIEYLNAKKALKINNKEKSENKQEIYCLKFWFSMDHGFIGVSGVGNYTSDFGENVSISSRGDGFTQNNIDYIKNELDIKTGTLKRVLTNTDYSKLKHGDYVIINLKSETNNRYITRARIFKDGNLLYAIHNNDRSSGGYPDYDYTSREESGDWRDWGRYSWSLGTANKSSSDHKNMYLYTPGDNPLEVKEDIIEGELSPFEFNLPFNNKFNLKPWSYYKEDDWSFQYIENKESFGWEKIEKSDFCIVLYLDDLLKEYKPSETSKKRKESREGATAFMSDDQIKRSNIERYLTFMLGKMGISKDVSKFKNLEKYIKSYICGEYSFFAIYIDRPNLSEINRFQKRLFNLLKFYNEHKKYGGESLKEEINSQFNYILGQYQSNINDSKDYKRKFDNNYSLVMETIAEKEFDNKEILKEFYMKLKNIGDYINNYLSNKEISSIFEFLFTYQKISSISNTIIDDTLRFSSNTRELMAEFRYNNTDKDDIERYLYRSSSYIEDDLDKLKEIEVFIKSILK